MAGHAARRIASHLRIAAAVSLIALAAAAHAGWEYTRFCRLSDDRILIVGGSQRYILTHAAAWELADPSQSAAFAKLLASAQLPKDLGQLVSSAPPDREIPLAGEVDASVGTTGETSLVFKLQGVISKPIAVGRTADGANLDAEGLSQFQAIAKSIGKPPSTVLVALADKSGKISDSEAWGAFLDRFKSSPEFFAYVGKQKGLLWIRHMQAPAAGLGAHASPNGRHLVMSEMLPPEGKPKSEPNSALTIGIAAIVALALGGAAGYWSGSRRKEPEVSPEAPTVPQKAAFSASERDLIKKVRDEVRKLNWPVGSVPSSEEVVVGQMIDRFNGYPSAEEELKRLQSYQQFKESHDQFQRQIDTAVADAKAVGIQIADLARKVHEAQAATKSAKAELAAKTGDLQKASIRIKELERSNEEFQQTYSELVSRSAAVCHDIVLTRPKGDPWALAFVYLVDYSLAYLGLAHQRNDPKTFHAMLLNLSGMSDAMLRAFPDRKLVIDPWQRSVRAFGEFRPPSYDHKPHPHVDSLSQILITVRDTGGNLREFREFFAPSDGGLHIIRPA